MRTPPVTYREAIPFRQMSNSTYVRAANKKETLLGNYPGRIFPRVIVTNCLKLMASQRRRFVPK